ncbi:MAG TPA: carboxypeptidase regulatory-like domain-containing protein [Polyangiaceae bacterium]|nr:carboxypeptidase regulatory-like domain-containing protein [Polyangiaceae bacterium]
MKRRYTFRLVSWLCCAALSLAPAAWGQEALRDNPTARQFFEIGAQAYAKGQYLLAIDAFEQAYALTERPGLLFSLAQANQRQFRISGDEKFLARAIDYCHKYLARVPEGGRHAEAQQQLRSLLVVIERLHPGSTGTDASPTRTQIFGRLLLSSSTPNAKLTVNGEPVEALPSALELPADNYKIVAEADGFERKEQELKITAGSSVPLNVELVALPSRFKLQGPAGAEVLLDGRPLGWLPLGEVQASPGEHWVTVRSPGRETRDVRVRLQRGQTTQVAVKLATTFQRKMAWASAGLGAAAALSAGGLAIAALVHDQEAETLEERRQRGELTPLEARSLNSHVGARNDFKTAALVTGLGSAALLGAAAVLYFADTPALPAPRDAGPGADRSDRRWQVAPIAGSVWGLSANTSF